MAGRKRESRDKVYNLNGRVAIVTGAGGEHGMGRAIANRLAQEGADVIITDIVNDPYAHDPARWGGASAVVREIEEMGRRSMRVLTDVSDANQVDGMVRQVLDRFGCIDILVNNAGSRPGPDRVPVVELDEAVWDEVQNINLKGTFLCCRAVSRFMIERGKGGKIINMSSTSGKHGRARFAAYCASKFGVRGFTQSLAQELAPHHINVNAICPGSVDTERVGYILEATSTEDVSAETWRTSNHRQAFIEERARNIPMGRVAEASDVARLAAFLASSQSDYITGLSLNIDGGSEMD
ncbi:MAG: SDR family NAD(P)-dependent oxidoreductase [Candidatus Poribacteria bacterium]|nr:SDR family NAD(P)-dependent oxidoreductase [Candidatus Poribacteria bacterium]MDE0505695.1 SDR family NAD(P)-dependent oxidoreductase [Candidatus Poribacteria bacterium]